MTRLSISVLVPVYNNSNLLCRCIDSVIAQTFVDFELILADDGSTDDTFAVCQNYAEIDSRIRVYHNENQGVSATREFLLRKAQGKYIKFIDSDDYITPNAIEILYKVAEREKAEIVTSNFIEKTQKGEIEHSMLDNDKKAFLSSMISGNWGVVWRMFVLRSFIEENDIHFPKNINGGEDYVFCVQLALTCSSIVSIADYIYVYMNDNPVSIMKSSSLKSMQDQVDATNIVIGMLGDKANSFREELTQRKRFAKTLFMRSFFIQGCKTYPEIDRDILRKGYIGKREIVMYMLSVILNSLNPKGIRIIQ